MKIINGIYSGRNIYMPAHVRPTQNLLRKAVFDLIGHDLSGLSFLELYAGSGAIGLEAVSCGAKEVTLVEHDPKCIEVIEQNIQRLNPAASGAQVVVLKQDAMFAVKEFERQGKRFDIVFFDPPYGLKLAKKTLKTLISHDIIHAHSFVVAQYDVDERMPELDGVLTIVKDKTYGASRLTIYSKVTKDEGRRTKDENA